MTTSKLRVAIYCRLSEEDRNKQSETDDSNSIQNQKSMLLQYSLEQGWEVYNIYSDDDYTGSDRRRPEFNRLLDDAENHKFDIPHFFKINLCQVTKQQYRQWNQKDKFIHLCCKLFIHPAKLSEQHSQYHHQKDRYGCIQTKN
jgi:site-specific DNA recombinase